MNTHRYLMIVVLLGAGMVAANAQGSARHANLAKLRESLKGLDWQKVDYDGAGPLERCRALLLLNDALDEVGAAALAEADLMSEFVQKQGIQEEYASKASAEAPPARTYEDGRKIALALLKGPMAESRYATELSKTDERGLEAYETMYDKTCRGKWDDFSEPVRYVRGMAAFLKGKDKIKDYMAWARSETDRRQHLHEQEMAERRAAAGARAKDEEAERKARAAELEEQRQQQADSRAAQEALYAAQQAETTAQDSVVVYDGDDDDWYPGWYYGVVSSARPRPRPLYRDPAYQAEARARVEQRRAAGPGAAAHPRTGGGRRP